MKTIFLLFLSLLLLTGCGGGGSSGSNNGPSQPKLEFTQAGDGDRAVLKTARAMATSATTAEPLDVDFNLGDIGATTTYLFMLRNTGNVPATNVVITADNPAVKVSPGVISVLQPEGVAGLLPIIRVTVQHGSQSTGIGIAPILPMGNFQFKLTATSDNGAFVQADLGGVARVADFRIDSPLRYVVGFPARMLDTDSGEMFNASFWADVWPASATAGLVNTGNTPLYVDISLGDGPVTQHYSVAYQRSVIVNPGETLPFSREENFYGWPDDLNYSNAAELFSVTTGGVIRADRVVDEHIFHLGWWLRVPVAN